MTTEKHPSQPKLPPKIYLNMQFVNIYVSYQQNCQNLHRSAFKTSKHTYHYDDCLQLLILFLYLVLISYHSVLLKNDAKIIYFHKIEKKSKL